MAAGCLWSIRPTASGTRCSRSWMHCSRGWGDARLANTRPLRGSRMSSVAVIGAGAWGTALAIQAARAGNGVALWARDAQRAGVIAASRDNPRLPGVRLPEPIAVSDAMPDGADIVLLAVPTQH